MIPWSTQHSKCPPRYRVAGMAAVILGVLLCRAPVSPGAEEDPKGIERLGMLIRVDLPITGQVARRVEHFVDQALQRAGREKQPILIFEFHVPEDEDQEKYAGRTEFSDALKLALLLTDERLASEHTVAYVPRLLPGHAVLVAMACEEIVMPGEAQLGPVGIESEAIEKTKRTAYTEIAGRRMTIPTEVALWLLDPTREVLVVQTDTGRECLTAEQLEELRQTERTILSEQPLQEWIEGQPGQLTGDEAWRLDIVSYKPDTPQQLAKLLDLPPEAMNEDPSLIQQWQAIQVNIEGRIQSAVGAQTIKLIKKHTGPGEKNNFVLVWIDSPGGSLNDSLYLADFLANALDPGKIRTVAYVAKEARADAALIALACDQVVMHPQAELGGSSDYVLSEEQIESAKQAIREEDGPWKSRSWSLIAAMIDPNLAVFRCQRAGKVDGEVTYLTKEQTEQLDTKKWTIGNDITRPGEPLSVGAKQAIQYRLANSTAENLDEFRQQYDLEELTVLEPGWVEDLILALASPRLSFLLLAIAFMAVYAELHAPGIGIGGFVATVCFLLFFWSQYLKGTATELEVILFVAGVVFLLLEIFVLPGFGIFGLGGGFLVLASLILASQTSVLPQSSDALWPVAAAMAVVVLVAVLLHHWFPRAPILREMILQPPAGEEAEDISRREALLDLEDFVGAQGTTTTQLTPSGKARFGDMLLDVITDGEVVQRGAKIEVVQVQGNRVIVRALEKR